MSFDAPALGPEAVLSVSTFLTRLDALESSPEREATRAADHAAQETLSKRGIDRAERTRLQSLVNLAKAVVHRAPAVISREATSISAARTP